MCIVHYRKNRLLCAECVICSNKNAFRERLKMAIDVDFWPDFEPFRLPSIHWTFSVSHCRISFCINISQTDRMLSCGYQTDCHRKWCMMRLTRDSLTDTTAGIHFDRYFPVRLHVMHRTVLPRPFCLFVCLSNVCIWQNDRNLCPHSYTTWKIIHPSFLTRRMVGGGTPSTWNFGANWPWPCWSENVCYKVSLCEYCQRQSCKAFTGLSIYAKLISGERSHKGKFSC